MTLREFYLERRRAELPLFLNVLRALPADALCYKPQERCASAEQIVSTLTSELRSCVEVARDGRTEWHPPAPAPLPEMIAEFERLSNDLVAAVERLDDTAWDRPGQFFYNGKLASEQPISQFLWFILFDNIHHRGQLAAYLRPMGGSVPSIYGPSGDSRKQSAA